jgi:hypothetical protein
MNKLQRTETAFADQSKQAQEVLKRTVTRD